VVERGDSVCGGGTGECLEIAAADIDRKFDPPSAEHRKLDTGIYRPKCSCEGVGDSVDSGPLRQFHLGDHQPSAGWIEHDSVVGEPSEDEIAVVGLVEYVFDGGSALVEDHGLDCKPDVGVASESVVGGHPGIVSALGNSRTEQSGSCCQGQVHVVHKGGGSIVGQYSSRGEGVGAVKKLDGLCEQVVAHDCGHGAGVRAEI